jgi:hypothetical protein
MNVKKYIDKIKSIICNYLIKSEKVYNYENEDKRELIDDCAIENKRWQEVLEKEYIDYKNLGLILIDIVPSKKRESIIEGLKRLFIYDKLTPLELEQSRIDIEKNVLKIENDAVLQGSFRAYIGRLQNSDIAGVFPGWPMAVKRELPPMIDNLDVHIMQFGDAYILTYVAELKDEYKAKGIKESFIHHRDSIVDEKKLDDGNIQRSMKLIGSESDPNIDIYLKELSGFLGEFSVGLYLNENPTQICPNIKITYIKTIPFNDFETWARQNIGILTFMGFIPGFYSKIKNYLWGIQEKRIKGSGSIEAGFIILASNDEDIGRDNASLDRGLLIDLTRLINRDFLINLLQLYWANHNVENIIKNWNNYIINKMEELNKIVYQQDEKKIDSLFELNTLIVNERRDFEGYRLEEEKKYDFFNTNIFFNEKFNESVTALNINKMEKNIYKYIYDSGKKLLDIEKIQNQNLKKEFHRLFQYITNITNLTNSKISIQIQKTIKYYTFGLLILTIILVITSPELSKWMADIWGFLYSIIAGRIPELSKNIADKITNISIFR